MQEEVTVEEVERWNPTVAAVDLELLFRRHGCSGPEPTYKYFQLFSVKYKEENLRSAPETEVRMAFNNQKKSRPICLIKPEH